MKLANRHFVQGTEPPIQIGHRVYIDPKTGKVKICRPWYAQWSQHGKQYTQSLHTTNKTVAIRQAHGIGQAIATGQGRSVNRHVTVEQLTEAYLALQRQRGRAPRTIEKYTLVMNNLLEWLGSYRKRPAGTMTESNFWDFKGHLDQKGLAAKTVYDRCVVVRQLFKWAARSQKVATNPLTIVSMTKPPPEPQPCFTPQQVGQLLEYADPHHRPIFAVMAYAGLRFGEVRDLQWSDVQFDQGCGGFLVVRRGGSTGLTKNRRVRRIPINDELKEILAPLPRGDGRVFSSRPTSHDPHGTKPLVERKLLAVLKRLCKQRGFANSKQYKLHTFRHAFASMCARNNVSERYALEWMGHTSSAILSLYYTMFDDTATAAMKTITYPPSSEDHQDKGVA